MTKHSIIILKVNSPKVKHSTIILEVSSQRVELRNDKNTKQFCYFQSKGFMLWFVIGHAILWPFCLRKPKVCYVYNLVCNVKHYLK